MTGVNSRFSMFGRNPNNDINTQAISDVEPDTPTLTEDELGLLCEVDDTDCSEMIEEFKNIEIKSEVPQTNAEIKWEELV